MDEPVNPYASPLAETMQMPASAGAEVASPALRRTGVGLTLVYYGILLILLTIIGLFFSVIFLRMGPLFKNGQPLIPGGLPDNFTIIILVGGISSLVGCLLMFAGQIVCLAVPSESGAKGFIIAVIILQIVSIVQSFSSVILQFAPNLKIPEPVSIILNFTGLVGTILFVLFLRKLSEYIGRMDFMDKARNILVLLLFLFAVGAVTVVGMMLINPLFGFLGIILAIGALFCFVMYVNLINALRKVLLGKEPRAKKSASFGRR
jgi:hypothetical protein